MSYSNLTIVSLNSTWTSAKELLVEQSNLILIMNSISKDTLLAALQFSDINKHQTKNNRIGDTPFRRIPNCREFKIELEGIDKVYELFHIKKNLDPKITITPYDNKSLNRYMEHQLIRLEKCRDSDAKLFWTIGNYLMLHSNVFITSCVNRLIPNWHRKYSLSHILSVIKKARIIIKKQDKKLIYKRVYIPKQESFRPLGVPTPEWRLVLHMYNQLLMTFLNSKIPSNQHGFRPGQGTLTAWQELMPKIISSRDVFEFDLSSFFENVNLDFILAKMRQMEVPKDIADWLHEVNQNAPTLPSETKLNEYAAWFKQNVRFERRLVSGSANVINQHGKFEINYMNKGVPQGAPTSPLLSCLALIPTVLRKFNNTQYADDGLYMGDLPENPMISDDFDELVNKLAGIEYNETKSGWVKRDYKWLKPLKFLGCEYDGNTNIFKAKTKKGSELEVTVEPENLIKIARFLESTDLRGVSSEVHLGSSWEDMIKSKIMGFIQSRIYSGNWNLEDLEQDFTLKYCLNSWTDKFKDKHAMKTVKHLNIFNSSSVACRSLTNILRGRTKSRKWNGKLNIYHYYLK